MSQEVTLIPGTGHGPAVASVAREVLAAAGASLTWDEQLCEGGDISGAVASIRRTGWALKGPIASEIRKGQLPPTVRLRRELGVYAIVRHVKHVPGLPARAPQTDLVVVREASEDIYAGFEHESADGVFESVKVTTRAACERIATFAFDYAQTHGRGRVTTVHKANILKKADGMFLSVSREVAARYPGIRHDDIIVDALCMRLVRRPRDFDVLLCGNLFGDIVSDCASGMAGGVTVASGVNYGPGVTVFEATPGVRGADLPEGAANPYPMILLAAELADALGHAQAAGRVRAAVSAALTAGVTTHDMGGVAAVDAVRSAVLGAL